MEEEKRALVNEKLEKEKRKKLEYDRKKTLEKKRAKVIEKERLRKVEEIKIDPKAYGIDYLKSTQPISLEESLQQTKEPSDNFKALAKFNAAVILFLTERADSVEEGLSLLG